MNTPIKREDIKAGDRIRSVREFMASYDFAPLDDDTTVYELIERPVVLPTEPGCYTDRQGDLWRMFDGRWYCLESPSETSPARYAPFTLLRPVAEVAAEVLAELHLDELASSGLYTRKYYGRELHAIAAKFGVTK